MNKGEIEKIKRLKKEAWANKQRYTGNKSGNKEYLAYHYGEYEAYKRVLSLASKK